MGFYKVRPGRVIGVSGVDKPEGTVIEIPDSIGKELANSGALDPCDATGKLVAPEVSTLEADLKSAQDHERVSLMEREEARLVQALEHIRADIAAEKSKAQKTASPDKGKSAKG